MSESPAPNVFRHGNDHDAGDTACFPFGLLRWSHHCVSCSLEVGNLQFRAQRIDQYPDRPREICREEQAERVRDQRRPFAEGQRIKTLLDVPLEAGMVEFRPDAANFSGQGADGSRVEYGAEFGAGLHGALGS